MQLPHQINQEKGDQGTQDGGEEERQGPMPYDAVEEGRGGFGDDGLHFFQGQDFGRSCGE